MTFNKTLIAIALASTLSACGSSSSDSDTTAPTITISGSSSITIDFNQAYVDAGATAIDDVDGAIAVTTTGTVDQSTAGDYTLTYTATDAAGNVSTETRTITVLDPPTNIGGTASKGLILDGAVTAYLINTDGTKGAEVGTATTDSDDGTYELTLDSSYDGEALIIEITAVDGSKMKCDLSVCLADDDDEVAITFGEIYTLPSDFELSAVSSGSDSDTISINITPLTNIAAALTLDKVAGGATPAAAAEASNYQIADLLGLDGDVTEQPIVDLTDPTAINGASAAELNANLKAAAVVEAAINGATEGTSLEAALDDFVTQYVASGGVAETEGVDVETSSVSLEEIAAASQELASAMVTELDGVNADDDNIAAVETALEAEELEASTGSTDATQGEVPDDLGSEGLLAAKAFVEQVSTFSLATQLDGVDANAFEDQISLASDLASSDLDVNAEALALATAAIAEAVDAVLNSDVPLTTYQSTDGVTVAISVSGTTVTYTVDQNLNVADATGVATTATINLVAALVFSDTITDTETESEIAGETEGNYNNTYTWSVDGTASVDLALSGSSSTAKASITIDDGSHFIATLTPDEEETEEYIGTSTGNTNTNSKDLAASGTISVTGVDVELSVTMAQVASDEITDPIEFTGALNIAATLLSIEYDETEQAEESNSSTGYSKDQTESETETISIDGLTASLSGTFSNSSDSLEATVAIAGSGIEETCVWNSEWSHTNPVDGDGTYSHNQSDECDLNETAETYASASINVRLALDVDGIDGDVELVAAVERTGLESGVASIDLTYGGNQLDFAFNTGDIVEEGEGDVTITTTITATLTNHNGVMLTVTNIETDYVTGSELTDTSVTTGVISHEGEEFATVSDEGLVRFSDGTFVTL